MKKTDMELKAIRDKLRLLESEPPAGDVLSAPWSSPQQSSFSPASFGSASFGSAAAHPIQQRPAQHTNPSVHSQAPGKSPQAVAIEALKQRSSVQSSHTNRADELISQEIYRLEVLAQNINERSQQQTAEILALKRSAQQAALALRRQGIHSHPQLDIIANFLAPYPSAAVPHLERDSQGRFALSHTTINLHHAEQEAQNTAEILRNRRSAAPLSGEGTHPPRESQYTPKTPNDTEVYLEGETHIQPLPKAPFSHPVTVGPSVDDYLAGDATDRSSRSRSSRRGKRWSLKLGNIFNRTQRKSPAYSMPVGNRFSWMDGVIWFSGAAIARIIIEAIVLNHPMLRMPLLLILFSVISFAIYRVVVSPSPNMTSAYRLGITLLGLFLGGSL